VNNRDPFVFKTTDYGQTWRSVSGASPQRAQLRDCVREDPVKRVCSISHRERALLSVDEARHWLPLQSGCRTRRCTG